MAKPKREEILSESEALDGDAYEAEVARLHKKQDWEGAVRYSREFERRIARLIHAGTATEDAKRLRLQALLDLQIAYSVLKRPKEQLRVAQEAHRSRLQMSGLDRLDDFYSFTFLGNAYADQAEPEKAREMFLCAGASVMTRRQAELLGNALESLAEFEQDRSSETAAAVIAELVKDLKRAAGKVQRRGQNAYRQAEIAEQAEMKMHLPERE